jgi:hypothetical protein
MRSHPRSRVSRLKKRRDENRPAVAGAWSFVTGGDAGADDVAGVDVVVDDSVI